MSKADYDESITYTYSDNTDYYITVINFFYKVFFKYDVIDYFFTFEEADEFIKGRIEEDGK